MAIHPAKLRLVWSRFSLHSSNFGLKIYIPEIFNEWILQIFGVICLVDNEVMLVLQRVCNTPEIEGIDTGNS